ncbi:S8 family serine peptidase [Lysobacter capsici]|uniref:S8 family serine peptidase n=1 Tax=Lysobacter capsici TaxID=435897 RepID=UPI00178176F4|nr:S8 family serine peptidase [Lysobacter capsici]
MRYVNTRSQPTRSHGLSLAIAASIGLCSLAGAPAFAGEARLSGLDAQPSFDRFIVRYVPGSAARGTASAKASALNRAAERVRRGAEPALALKTLRSTALAGTDVVIADRRLDRDQAAALMRRLAADPQVDYVEIDARMHTTMTPNDPSYPLQWGYNDADAGIRAEQAWDIGNGAGVVVAVLDTGITSHGDLNANIVAGYDFINDAATARDGNGRDPNPNDEGDWESAGECGPFAAANSSWHGTHVAGTIAAVTNNGSGVAGTAFGARVQPVRVLGRCGGYLSDIADAIVWASGGAVAGIPANATPANVINMSLGGSGVCSATYQNAIDGAVARGTTVVVAAGNGNVDAANANPANCNNVIAVGAVDSNGARSVWNASQQSNFGALVDLAAPGTDIYSTLNSGATTPAAASYGYMSGTSMAAPHVAGVVALLRSVSSQQRTPAQIESLLKSTATPFPSTPSQPIGTGIVNAAAAVNAVASGAAPGTIVGMGNKCLDVRGGATANASVVQVFGCNGFAQQNWSLGDTYANLRGVPSGRMLDVVGINPDNGAQLQIYDATGASNQAWSFTNTTILSLGSKAVDAIGGSSANGTLLQLWDSSGVAQQTWNFNPQTGAITGIGGKCLDVIGGNSADGTPVQLWDCSGVAQQKWRLGPGGRILGIGGKCLEAANGSFANGTQIRIWSCNGLPHQSWRLRGEIRSGLNGKCLDDPNLGQYDGSLVHMWTCHGGPNQRWEYRSY